MIAETRSAEKPRRTSAFQTRPRRFSLGRDAWDFQSFANARASVFSSCSPASLSRAARIVSSENPRAESSLAMRALP